MAPSRKAHITPFTIHCDEADDLADEDWEATALKSYPHSSLPTRADSPIESVESASTTDSGSANNFSSTDISSAESDHAAARKDASSPRRTTSNITRTSISSFPDSALPSDIEGESYTPTRPRPSFRPSSVHRIQAGSPSSDRTRLSPRPSSLFSTRARSLRSATIRSSPRPRTRERQEERDRLTYPLVLLHITLLPSALPWSLRTLLEVLPEEVRERLALLRSKTTETVLKRGILIPHPQEDFEILEERVLEALELVQGRIGRGGEFIPRRDGWSGDSIVGLYGNEEETAKDCDLECGDDEDDQTGGVDEDDNAGAWNVRVYAANGLMRAGAWAAAWNEMERVDVEVSPFISDEIRKRLDEMQAEEDKMMVERRLQEEAQIAAMAAEQRIKDAMYEPSFEREGPLEPIQKPTTSELIPQTRRQEHHQRKRIDEPEPIHRQEPQAPTQAKKENLPAAYRPKEVPLDVLLRNYLYLLAQDRRNLAIIFLVVMVFFSSLHGMMRTKPGTALGVYDNFSAVEMHVVKGMLQNDINNDLDLEVGGLYGSLWNVNEPEEVGATENPDATDDVDATKEGHLVQITSATDGAEPSEDDDSKEDIASAQTSEVTEPRITTIEKEEDSTILGATSDDKQYENSYRRDTQDHDTQCEPLGGLFIIKETAICVMGAVSGALDAMSEGLVE